MRDPHSEDFERTDLVYHIRQLTLHFVRLNFLFAADVDGGGKLGHSDSRAPGWRGIRRFGLRFLKSAGDEDFAQQITQTDVMRSLQGKVDAPFYELILAILQSLVKGVEVALLDAVSQGREEFLEAWIRL